MMKECDGTLITRNGPSVRLNNLLKMLVCMDDASLSWVAVSVALETITKSCGLNAGGLRTRRPVAVHVLLL